MNKYEFNATQAPAVPGKKRAPVAEASAASPASPKKLKVTVSAAAKKTEAQAETAELGERGEKAAPVVVVVTPDPVPPPARQAGPDESTSADRRPGGSAPRAASNRTAAPAGEIIGQDSLADGAGAAVEFAVCGDMLAGGEEIGLAGLLLGADDERPNPAIPGVSDRVHYLAMAAISVFPGLRSGAKKRESTLQPVGRPASRSECERRCGSDGFCDPSSKFGCGGEHCGYLHERL